MDWPHFALYPVSTYLTSVLDEHDGHCYCAQRKEMKKTIMVKDVVKHKYVSNKRLRKQG